MSLLAKRLPSYGTTINLFSGAVTTADLFDYVRGLDATDMFRWLNYIDPTCDMTGVDLGSTPELKRFVASKLSEYRGTEPVRVTFVTGPGGPNAQVLHFWSDYVGADEKYPADANWFTNVREACEWLGLPEPGRQAVIQAVEARNANT